MIILDPLLKTLDHWDNDILSPTEVADRIDNIIKL